MQRFIYSSKNFLFTRKWMSRLFMVAKNEIFRCPHTYVFYSNYKFRSANNMSVNTLSIKESHSICAKKSIHFLSIMWFLTLYARAIFVRNQIVTMSWRKILRPNEFNKIVRKRKFRNENKISIFSSSASSLSSCFKIKSNLLSHGVFSQIHVNI